MDTSRDLIWTEGIGHELEFWKTWLSTKGGKWPNEYRDRLDPELPLQAYLLEYIRHLVPRGSTLNILDVGAGPLTMLGKVNPDYKIILRAADALADYYSSLLKEFHVQPPVPTEKAFVENLTDVYAAGSFDLVHINNALDHSSDPLKGILEMLSVVKSGHFVVINSFINEGRKAEYIGLHQWNFDVHENEFIIGNRFGQHISITNVLRGLAEIRIASHLENDWVSVVLKKLVSNETDIANVTGMAIRSTHV
jgi:SAM-dependent methyltransferase